MITLAEFDADEYHGQDLSTWYGSVQIRRRKGTWTTNEDGLVTTHPDGSTALWWAREMNLRKNPP